MDDDLYTPGPSQEEANNAKSLLTQIIEPDLYEPGPTLEEYELADGAQRLRDAIKSDSASRHTEKWARDEPIRLSKLLAVKEIREYLLKSNTFIHGKVGFYDYLLAKIHASSNILPDQVVYWKKTANLPSLKSRRQEPRAILLPLVKSDDDLNTLIATALYKAKALWLVAQPEKVQKNLLLAFDNFFIANGVGTELSTLCGILHLPKRVADELTNGTSENKIIFITNHSLLVKEIGGGTAAIFWLDLD